MDHIEYEVLALEINVDEIKQKLGELNTTLVEDDFQRID